MSAFPISCQCGHLKLPEVLVLWEHFNHHLKILTMKRFAFLFLFVISVAAAFAQQRGSVTHITDQDGYTSLDAWVDKNYELDRAISFVEESRHQQNENRTVIRYRQLYNKIPTNHAHVIAHFEDGRLTKVINKPLPMTVATSPAIQEKQSVEILGDLIGENRTWHLITEPELRISTKVGAPELVWVIGAHVSNPLEGFDYMISAQTGKLVDKEITLYTCNDQGTAHTAHEQTQTITTDGSGTDWVLNDCTRGSGIHTVDWQGGFNPIFYTDFHDNDNTWNDYTAANEGDRYALDVHYGSAATFDYFMNEFQEDVTYGQVLRSYLNPGHPDYINNAAYSSSLNAAIYGNTGPTGTGLPYVTFDIVAHEITHGVTHHTAGLEYEGESGAINEAISDIFAVAIEAEYGDLNWTVGEDIGAVRDLCNPSAFGDPDTYMDHNWYTGTDNSEFVHTNSGVLNHWFCLLVNGGTGVNSNGDAYDVDLIGMEKATLLVFELLMGYLTESNDYHETRLLSLQAAADLFGACTPEYISVVNAWAAVGIGLPWQGFDAPTNLATLDITNCSALLTWDDMGYLGYLVQWREVGTSQWNYESAVSVPQFLLSGLSGTTTYEWAVSSICGDIVVTSLGTVEFTTLDECPQPQNVTLSDITICSAMIAWDDNAATGYTVYYREVGTASWIPQTATGNSLVLSGLMPDTEYDFTVISNCGPTCNSNVIAPVRFKTLTCDPLTDFSITLTPCKLYFQWVQLPGQNVTAHYSFDGGFSYFEAQVTDNTAITGHGLPAGTQFQAYLQYQCVGDGCVETRTTQLVFATVPTPDVCTPPSNPLIDFIENDVAIVSWQAGGQASEFEVQYRYTPNGAWQTGQYFNGNFFFIDLLNSAQCLYVRVRSVCNCDNDPPPVTTSAWVEFSSCKDCVSPSDLEVIEVCPTYAEIGFSGQLGQSSFNIQYREVLTQLAVNDFATANSDSYVATGLQPGTSYQFRILSICSMGTAQWSDWITFNTPRECRAPLNLQALAIGNSMVELSWNSAGPGAYYTVEYRPVGSSTWITLEVGNNSTDLIGLDLDANDYEIRVKTHCSDCNESDWSTILVVSDCLAGYELRPQWEGPNGSFCHPCYGNCSLCIFDIHGNSLASSGMEFEIDWTFPPNYVPQITPLKHCVSIGPGNDGETFLAEVSVFEIVDGLKELVCTSTLSYTLDCSSPGEGPGPTNIHCIPDPHGNNVIEVTWDHVPGAVSYEAQYYYTDPSCTNAVSTVYQAAQGGSTLVLPNQNGKTRVRTFDNGGKPSTWAAWTCFGPGFCEDPGKSKRPHETTHALTDKAISVYPNPSRGQLQLAYDVEISGNYQVFSANGQLVATGRLSSGGATQLDLFHLSNGLYTVRIMSAEQAILHTERFMIAD